MAEVSDPDAHDGIGFGDDVPSAEGSPGANFLRRVESDAFELADELATTVDEDRAGSYIDRADYDGRLSEYADGAVPVYTHERWQVFTDLCAYDEDTDDLAGPDTDMTQRAGIALYMIAERLLCAILEAEDPAEEDDDE